MTTFMTPYIYRKGATYSADCAKCGATAIIHGIVIAIATELLLYFILGLWAGDFLVGASAFLLLGGLAAYVIYQVVFPSLLKVSPFR